MLTGLFGKALIAGGLVSALTAAAAAQNTGNSPRSEATSRSTDLSVAVKARGSVDQTLAALKKMVAGNGMMVMGEIHQGKMLEITGLRVRSETIFVGNPNVGKQLFSLEPGVGLIVPIRINIYEDGRGQTYVRYIPPSRQLGGFGNAKVNEIAKMLDAKLHDMAAMLSR